MTAYPEILEIVNSAPNHLTRRITGQRVARGRLSRRQRIELAAALTNGSVVITPMTARQACAIAQAPIAEVSKARRVNGNGKPGPNGETLAQHIARSTLAERIEAVRVVGVDNLWDSMLAPIVGQRG